MTYEDFLTVPKIDASYLIPADKREQSKFLAELFCNLNSGEQADFFDRIAEINKNHWRHAGPFQWRAMMADLTPQAKDIIDDIKNHTDKEDK